MLDSAARSVSKLGEKIDEQVFRCLEIKGQHQWPFDRIKTTDAAKLQDEYAKLVEGLQEATEEDEDTDGFMANPRKLFFPRKLQLTPYCYCY